MHSRYSNLTELTGLSYWPVILACHTGLSYWPVVLVCHTGLSYWFVILVCHTSLLSYWSVIQVFCHTGLSYKSSVILVCHISLVYRCLHLVSAYPLACTVRGEHAALPSLSLSLSSSLLPSLSLSSSLSPSPAILWKNYYQITLIHILIDTDYISQTF